MLKKTGWRGMVVILVVCVLLATIWLTLFGLEEGMSNDIGIQYPSLPAGDYSSVPQSVIDSAVELAAGLVGNSQAKLQNTVDQFLTAYEEAKGRDFVIVFNSGGWGKSLSQESGWGSILDGIKSQLESQGYQTMIMNYRRTSGGLSGFMREFMEALTRYPHKARYLAARIEFLTANLPNLRVIITAESTGTVITDKTMAILKDDPRVYSIQTGTPFWHESSSLERTLLMNTNGAVPDTFSYGDIPAIVWSTVKNCFGLSSKSDKPGHILFWLRAPGHDYSWQYPGVYNKVVEFIQNNFGQNE